MDPAIDTTKPATAETPVLSPQEMSESQLQEFLAKGTRFPKEDKPAEPADGESKTDANDADSSTAPAEGEKAAETAASPEAASETAKPEKKPKGKGLKARIEQIDQENVELERTLSAALRRRRELTDQLARETAEQPPATPPKPDATTADSSPAATAPTDADYKRIMALPGAPKAEQFDGDLDAYTAAVSAFVVKQVAKEQFDQMFNERQSQSAAEAEQLRELQEAFTAAEARAKADETRDPQWRDKLDPALAAIPPQRLLEPGQKPHAMHFIKDQVMFECEHPCSLLVFMSTPEGKQWAFGLAKMHPQRIIREIALKDASFADAPDDHDKPPSHVSAAPPPGPTLGRKPSAPVDPLKHAIDSGDPLSYIEQRNKQVVGAGSR